MVNSESLLMNVVLWSKFGSSSGSEIEITSSDQHSSVNDHHLKNKTKKPLNC